MRMIVIGMLLGTLFLTGCGGGETEGPSLAQQAKQAMLESSPEVRTKKLISVSAKQQKAGDARGASGSLSAAADAAKSIESPASRVQSLCLVVGALQGGGDSKDLLKAASKALDEINEPKDKAVATARYALALGKDLKDTDKATAYLKMAADEAGKVEAPADKAAALLALASTYQQLDVTDQAESLTTTALEAAASIADERKKCETLASAGLTLSRMKQADASKKAFDDASAVASAISDPLSQGYAYLDVANAMISAGQKGDASTLLDKASKSADKAEASLKGSLVEAIGRARGKI